MAQIHYGRFNQVQLFLQIRYFFPLFHCMEFKIIFQLFIACVLSQYLLD